MSEDHHLQGKTTVSPEVLGAIARMAALSVPGVKSVGTAAPGASRVFRRRGVDGIHVDLQDNLMQADIHLVVRDGFNIREVGRDVQNQVARAIQEMVGMDVGRIDIHVEDIDFGGAEA